MPTTAPTTETSIIEVREETTVPTTAADPATTAGPTTTAAVAVAGSLPVTGSTTGPLLAAAGTLIVLGLALVARSRMTA